MHGLDAALREPSGGAQADVLVQRCARARSGSRARCSQRCGRARVEVADIGAEAARASARGRCRCRPSPVARAAAAASCASASPSGARTRRGRRASARTRPKLDARCGRRRSVNLQAGRAGWRRPPRAASLRRRRARRCPRRLRRCTMCTCGPQGAHCSGFVGPSTHSTGVPTAAARWRRPGVVGHQQRRAQQDRAVGAELDASQRGDCRGSARARSPLRRARGRPPRRRPRGRSGARVNCGNCRPRLVELLERCRRRTGRSRRSPAPTPCLRPATASALAYIGGGESAGRSRCGGACTMRSNRHASSQ